MAGVNMTEVRLLKAPLENDYLHTYHFDNLSTQVTFFQSLENIRAQELSYQRKDNVIRFPRKYDDLLGYNYVMYKNAAYSDKWYYAFITDMSYVDDGRTDISIETDVIQTWMFNPDGSAGYTVKPSFIEREHVNDDTVGAHTVPEGLELGEYICNTSNRHIGLSAIYGNIIVGSTVDLTKYADKEFANVGGKQYNGVYSGIRYYDIPVSYLDGVLKNVADAGKSDAIVSIFTAPSSFIKTEATQGAIREVSNSTTTTSIDWVNSTMESPNKKPTKLNGYEPKNKKLLTYPYVYMNMSNNSGGSAIYHYEYFKNPDDETICNFKIHGALTPGMSIRLIPQNYKGVIANNEEGLNLGKFPICAWTTDVYINWLTQNAVNIGLGMLPAAGQMATGVIATGMGAVGIGAQQFGSGLMGVLGSLGEVYSHMLQPPQAEGNINSGDVSYAAGNLTFTAYHMSIKKEFAQIIDSFFNMYGYKVNRVGVPLTKHREAYWYIKTRDVNIDGNVPVGDLQKIKACYNNGITFWSARNSIGNYGVSNKIKE